METTTAAVVQLSSTSDREANWEQASDLVRQAAAAGASFVATPENTTYLGPHEEKVRLAEPLEGPACMRFAELARECGVHLLLGSFNEIGPDEEHCYNTSVLFSPVGDRLAIYRKIHLFDIDLSDKVHFTESATVAPGSQTVVADLPFAEVGLSICYDLRFPELYRRLAEAGAELLMVPSAFTAPTGAAHWHTLLRARAIENQCFVLAPAQWGRHDDQGLRESYGHALIYDPWGELLAEADEGPGWVAAELDAERLARVRRSLPALSHRRL